MDRAVCIATIWLCAAAYCLGLDFTLKQESKSSDKSQNACGILTCLEDTSVSASLTSQKDRANSSVSLNNISSMSVFKKESITSDKFLLGSVTSQSPNLTVVANGVDSLESNMEDKIHSLNNNMDDTKQSVESKVDSLESNMEDKIHSLDNKMDDTKQSVESKVGSLVNIIHGKLDILENRIEDKIDNNNILNKLIQMDFKVSKELANFRQETKSDISGSLEALTKKSNKVLGKFSESFERNMNKTSGLLVSMEDSFDSLMSRGLPKLYKDIKTTMVKSLEAFKNRTNEEQTKSLETFSDSVDVTLNKTSGIITSMKNGFEDFIKLSQMDLASVKNETETIHDLLVEGFT
ncbi:hypothetical protein ElyMa_001767000, partial [Elysia marginata]